jgi:signal transduction histidine kinase
MNQTLNQPGNLLIVDDGPNNLLLLSNILGAQGYKVRAVRSGQHALAAAQAAPPDLILLDILMPEMDGYEVCQRLKANVVTQHIPVIFISALDDVWDKVQAFSIGAVDFVTKPFQSAEVLARVETHLTLQRLNQELHRANAELSRNILELEARNAELDAFAHTVAHDLKSPLALLVGYAEHLRDTWRSTAPDEVDEYLDILFSGGQKCSRIVDDILLLASLRKQALIPQQRLAMLAILDEVEMRLKMLITTTQPEIVKPLSLPTALGYAPWIEEVWVNYMSNALKYGSTPPRVEVGADILDSDQVRFWVKDNGMGIPEEKLPMLFTEFGQVEDTERKPGTESHGLGLSIVRRIVERLGGQVGAESQPGEGSTFWFTLPLSMK